MTLRLQKKHKNKILILLAVLSMTLGYAVTSYAEQEEQNGIASLIEQIIMNKEPGAGGISADGIKVVMADRKAMETFYQGREFSPLWITSRGNERIAEALEIFEASWTHGLNPKTYHVGEIRKLMEGENKTDKAALDLLMTDAALRYGRDLSGMRINPRAIKQKSDYWRKPLTGTEVLGRFAVNASPVAAMRELEPNTPLYKALQKELVRLHSEQSDYEHVLPLKFGGSQHFTPGSKNKDIPGLRLRLGMAENTVTPTLYDDETAAVVMKLQRKHGLEADGIIGPQTLAILNQSSKARMEQVIANLERLRWLEQERPERYLLVNIPQQLVWAVENGKVAFESKVVVGMPSRRTKDFKTDVIGVRFNPNWTVPMGIKLQDFVPKLQDNPDYMTEKGMEIIQGHGSNAMTLDPRGIDWANISRQELADMRFVQHPGSNNALGSVRILMPNDYDIYMHDTNHPEFFEKDQRTYSSGCIRLSEPEKVANFVLAPNDGWTTAKMDSLIEAGKTVEVKTEKPFPAYIIYQTMWLDNGGRLVYGADVYKRDSELIEVLAQMDGFDLPDATDTRFAEAEEGGKAALALNN